ncbi:hypothetical protein [Campylobacter concisus]|nr:hypothetical protein [Campylobacter concisus]
MAKICPVCTTKRAVDLARNSTKKPENYDAGLVAMLEELYAGARC